MFSAAVQLNMFWHKTTSLISLYLSSSTQLILSANPENALTLPSSALDILETLIEFQPTLGKLYNTVGGLNTLVAKLLGAASQQLKQKLLKIINSLPNDGRKRLFVV